MWHINIHFRFDARPCVYSTKAEIARVFCMCEWVWVMRANVVAGIWSVPCGPWPWSLPARKWSCVLCECARKCVCVCAALCICNRNAHFYRKRTRFSSIKTCICCALINKVYQSIYILNLICSKSKKKKNKQQFISWRCFVFIPLLRRSLKYLST